MRCFLYTLVILFGLQSSAAAFEIVNKNTSYENNRFLALQVGLGINQFTQATGVEAGNPGLLFQLGFEHRLSQYLGAELVYQLGTIRFYSPDPIAPADQIHTRTGIQQEFLRLKAYLPTVVAQPYISAGFGSYQFFGTSAETALSLPANFMIPFGAGVKTYVMKDKISLDFDFNYFLFLGENQDSTTLTILGLPEVSFNMMSLTGGFTFYFL